MTALQFESLRHEISHYVHESREPLSSAALMEMCKLAQDTKQVSNAVFNMCKTNQLTRHGASGSGTRPLYGPGQVKLGAAEPGEKDAGGGCPEGEREKGKGKSRAAREEVPQAGGAESASQ